MCLAAPGMVLEVNNESKQALVETLGIKRIAAMDLVGAITPGEFVMVHAGYAIEKIDLVEAAARIKLWEEILQIEDVTTVP